MYRRAQVTYQHGMTSISHKRDPAVGVDPSLKGVSDDETRLHTLLYEGHEFRYSRIKEVR